MYINIKLNQIADDITKKSAIEINWNIKIHVFPARCMTIYISF